MPPTGGRARAFSTTRGRCCPNASIAAERRAAGVGALARASSADARRRSSAVSSVSSRRSCRSEARHTARAPVPACACTMSALSSSSGCESVAECAPRLLASPCVWPTPPQLGRPFGLMRSVAPPRRRAFPATASSPAGSAGTACAGADANVVRVGSVPGRRPDGIRMALLSSSAVCVCPRLSASSRAVCAGCTSLFLPARVLVRMIPIRTLAHNHGSACSSSKAWTRSAWPWVAAVCKAVRSPSVRNCQPLTSAPRSLTQRVTTETSPRATACQSMRSHGGVTPG
mmetsp:Transcript_11962/g.31289  ORF Transcript_11962/g.31289 Transcript_11962/m.31289 type:complete len:286 (-) Transcript_11962:138-995(-)